MKKKIFNESKILSVLKMYEVTILFFDERFNFIEAADGGPAIH